MADPVPFESFPLANQPAQPSPPANQPTQPSPPADQTDQLQSTETAQPTQPSPAPFESFPAAPAFESFPTSQEYYSTPEQQVKTIVEQGLSGLTGGLSQILETKGLGVNPEDIKGRQEANTGESLLANAIGNVGLFTATGGLGLGAEAGAGLGEIALRAAAQGALLGGGNALTTDIAMGDPSVNGSKIASDVGISSLLGAGIGGIGEALVGGLGGKILGKAPAFINDAINTLQSYVKYGDPVEAISKELTPYLSANENGFDIWGANGTKMQAIEKLLPPQLTDQMVDQVSGVLNQGRATIQSLMADRDLYTPYYTRVLNRAINNLGNAMGEATDPLSNFHAMNTFKQELDSVLPHSSADWFKLAPQDKPAIEVLSGIVQNVRNGLQDPEVWGNAGEVQQTINKAFTQFKPDLNAFQSKFLTKDGGLDLGKVQTYVNQTGKAGQEVRKETLGDFINSSENFRQAIGDVTDKAGLNNPFNSQPLEYTRSTMTKQTPGNMFGHYLWQKGGLSRLSGEALGAGIGAAAGSALGNPVIGTLIGERALSPVFARLVPPDLFASPLRVVQGTINAIDNQTSKIGSGARLIFTGASSQARKIVQ